MKLLTRGVFNSFFFSGMCLSVWFWRIYCRVVRYSQCRLCWHWLFDSWDPILCGKRMDLSPHVRSFKTVLDSGFQAVDSRFQGSHSFWDANLRGSKILRLSILHYIHLAKCQQPQHLPPPPTNWPSHNGLGYYMRSYMKYMLSKYVQKKKVPETVLWVKSSNFEGKNGLNFKLKHRKAQKSLLCGRFGDPYGRAEGQCCIRESCHICSLWVELRFSIPFVGGDSAFLGLNSGFESSVFLIRQEKLFWILDSVSKNFP